MKIKWFIFFLSIMTISFIFYSFIEKKADPPIKIGVLLIGENRYEKLAGLKKGLADIGYKDKELTYIVKNANEQQDKLEVMITSLLNKQPHVIVTLGGIETVQLKEKLEKENLYIPVVFAGVAAPKELGLINDYRSPGGQYTGINNYHTSISGKRLELFKELIPSLKRVHLLYDEEIEVSR
ncbi:hypothetical protein K6959_01990 [Bacillus aquiflavi]|nr:hypothetical protein K6959_01990 [Bacillus aquiflavi]